MNATNSNRLVTLEDIITVGLNCVEQGIDTQENVKRSILGYVGEHYIAPERITRADEIPASVLDMLQRVCGLSFEARDGRISGVLREPEKSETVARAEAKVQRVAALLCMPDDLKAVMAKGGRPEYE